MLEQINNLRERGQNELNALTGTDQLTEWYHRYLGRKGDLTSLLKKLKTLPVEERPETGKVINKVKQELQEFKCAWGLLNQKFLNGLSTD